MNPDPNHAITKPSLQDVADHGLCIGCGACLFADPALRLRFDETKMMYAPSAPGSDQARGVCPSIRVDFEALHRRLFPGREATPLGVIEEVALAQSRDTQRNLLASSGGIIKEVLHYGLASGRFDGAIALRHVQGLDYEPALIRDPAEVDALPGSIYHCIPFDKTLRLLAENRGRFIVVATPCQLEGLYSAIFTCQPELAGRIGLTIGLICGWQYTHHALRAICRYKGVDFGRIEEVAYRGGGPVGKLRIRTPDGICKVNRRVDFSYQAAFDRTFNVPRCHLCVNHSNFLSDLVVGDAWLPSTLKTRTGISLVICRKPEAAGLMRELADKGLIHQERVSTDEIIESQTRRVALGDFAYAYAEYLDGIGKFRPQMAGPNRAAAAPVSRRSVERFHRELEIKLRLQRQCSYRRLWVRKLTLEFGKFSWRYLRWFFVRVVKVKSLLGLRKEVSSEKLSSFR